MDRQRFMVAGAFITGVAAGVFIMAMASVGPGGQRMDRQQVREGGYRFINPLLECEIGGEQVEFTLLKPFKEKLVAKVDELTRGPGVGIVAVYFRDLENGPWLGVNEKERFSPASLLKVPLMMALLKQAEQDPRMLERKISVTAAASPAFTETIAPSRQVRPGESYTVDELIERMIVYSDNRAAQALTTVLDERIQDRVFHDIGAVDPAVRKQNDALSVKMYSSFFRILFNASYLNREMSERALRYLSMTEFRGGIVAAVPAGIAVAHKFGERSLGNQGEVLQLHDCGIVYHPDRPYLLCMMTRGSSFEALTNVISSVSEMVYREISRQAGEDGRIAAERP